jgi:hypothetical protein
MEYLSLTIGKAFDTSAMILIVGLVRLAVDIAKLFVLSKIHFIRFGPYGGVGYRGAYTFSGWGHPW